VGAIIVVAIGASENPPERSEPEYTLRHVSLESALFVSELLQWPAVTRVTLAHAPIKLTENLSVAFTMPRT